MSPTRAISLNNDCKASTTFTYATYITAYQLDTHWTSCQIWLVSYQVWLVMSHTWFIIQLPKVWLVMSHTWFIMQLPSLVRYGKSWKVKELHSFGINRTVLSLRKDNKQDSNSTNTYFFAYSKIPGLILLLFVSWKSGRCQALTYPWVLRLNICPPLV